MTVRGVAKIFHKGRALRVQVRTGYGSVMAGDLWVEGSADELNAAVAPWGGRLEWKELSEHRASSLVDYILPAGAFALHVALTALVGDA